MNLLDNRHANKWLLACLLLNSGDGLLTYLVVTSGATEVNPFMAALIKLGMLWFLIDKLVITNFIIGFVGWGAKNYRIGRVGLVLASCTYTLLIIYHLINLCLIAMTSN